MPDLLTALCRLDDALGKAGLVPDLAVGRATIFGDIVFDPSGEVTGIDLRQRHEIVPRLPQRTRGVVAAFLVGTLPYWRGGRSRRDQDSLAAMCELHERVLGGLRGDPDVHALLSGLASPRGDLGEAAGTPGLFLPRIGDAYLHTRDDVVAAWRRAFEPPGGNPLIRVGHKSPVRLVSSNLPSARSYGRDDAQLPPGVTSHAYGRALNWLLDRETTVRIGDTAFAAWCDADLDLDPTPIILPRARTEAVIEDWPGAVHVVAIQEVPPGRAAVRLYDVVDGALLGARLRDFYSTFSAPTAWFWALPEAGRAANTTHALRAILDGRRLPPGIVARLVSELRYRQRSEAMGVALLEGALRFGR